MLICACICECVMRGVWARGKGRLWWHPPTLCPCLPPGATKAAGGTQAAKGAASMGASRTLSTAASSARSPMLGRGAPAAAGFRCAWLHAPPPIPSPCPPRPSPPCASGVHVPPPEPCSSSPPPLSPPPFPPLRCICRQLRTLAPARRVPMAVLALASARSAAVASLKPRVAAGPALRRF